MLKTRCIPKFALFSVSPHLLYSAVDSYNSNHSAESSPCFPLNVGGALNFIIAIPTALFWVPVEYLHPAVGRRPSFLPALFLLPEMLIVELSAESSPYWPQTQFASPLPIQARALHEMPLFRCYPIQVHGLPARFQIHRSVALPNKSPSSETRPSFLSGENRHTSPESESCLSSKEFSHGPFNKSLLSHAREDSLKAPSRHVLSPKQLSRTLPDARCATISPSLALRASCAYLQWPLPPCPSGFVSS